MHFACLYDVFKENVMFKYPLFVSGYKKVCYANSQSKLLRQGFVSRSACVKLKFKTVLATSLHLKITVNIFSHTNIGFKKSSKNSKGLTISCSSEGFEF